MLVASSEFNRLANSWVRPISWRFSMAWDKIRDDAISWGVYDVSTYDSGDLYASDVNTQPPVQIWDTYKQHDVSGRVGSLSISRSIDFPFNVQSAICDISLANHDNFFTPVSNSPIAEYIKPKIPVRAWLGFSGAENLPQFVGLTDDMPDAEPGEAEAKLVAYDFLAWALTQPMPDVAPMANRRTDYILSELFKGIGFAAHQFSFTGATNVVPIFFPNQSDSFADTVKKLVQAENGKLWQDESGIIRFSGRGMDTPQAVDMEFNNDNVISVKQSKTVGIVNHIHIITPIRVIASYQMVSEKSSSGENVDNLWVVSNGNPITRSASLDDPCLDVVTPTIGKNSSVSWFTAKQSSGEIVTSGVTCTLDLNPDKALMTFTSSLPYPVEIDEIFLWGQPSRVIDQLDYEVFDDSWSDDNDHLLSITDNEFFGNYDNAKAFAQNVFIGYSQYSPTIEVEAKGSPAIQLGDVFNIDTRIATGSYQIIGTSQKVENSKLTTVLVGKKTKIWTLGVYDISVYDGTDVYGFV